MSRSKWKGAFVDKKFLNAFLKVKSVINELDVEQVKTFNYHGNLRNSTVISSFVGYEFLVFNGRKFNPVVVYPDMIGFKFGDFSLVNAVGKYEGRKGKAIRSHRRVVRKINEKKARRERRIKKLLEADD